MQVNNKIYFQYNDKLRIKITDKCNLTCPFCHAEGTKNTESISLEDNDFVRWIKKLRLNFSRIHLTGGEPTLYERLPELCEFLHLIGYDVSITTNLLLLSKNLVDALPFLTKINISLHTFSPEYFRDYIKNPEKSAECLKLIKKNILQLKKVFQNISINTVVSGEKKQGLSQVLDFCKKNKIYLKLVPDWRNLKVAKSYIHEFLQKNNFKELKRIVKLPGSNLRIIYSNNDFCIELKDIKPFYPDFLCTGCRLRKYCVEKFSFLRLEGNPLRFKVCINKPALTGSDFEKNFLPAYKNMTNQLSLKYF